jgi:hypothetical protein
MGNCCSGLLGNSGKKQSHSIKSKNELKGKLSTNFNNFSDYYDDEDDEHVGKANQKRQQKRKDKNSDKKKRYQMPPLKGVDLAIRQQKPDEANLISKQNSTDFSQSNSASNSIHLQHSSLYKNAVSSRRDNSQIINNLNKVSCSNQNQLSKSKGIAGSTTNDTAPLLQVSSSSSFNMSQANESSLALEQNPNLTPKMNKLRKRDNYLMQSLNETDRHKSRLKHLINESVDELVNKASSSKELKEENEEGDECKPTQKKIESTIDYTDDEEDVYDENERDEKEIRNHKRQAIYRSLQKSKRSIKTIEETLKNSRSIEKWLNDFSNLSLNEMKNQQQNKNKKNKITQVQEEEQEDLGAEQLGERFSKEEAPSEETTTAQSEWSEQMKSVAQEEDMELYDYLNDFISSTTKLSTNSSSTNGTPCSELTKLNKTIIYLIRQTRTSIQPNELEMTKYLSDLILPRSLANIDDIELLKCILNERNFYLKLIEPVFTQFFQTNDHLYHMNELNYDYLLYPANLNISLLQNNDSHDHNQELLDESDSDDVELDQEDKCFLAFNNSTRQLCVLNKKIESVLNKEKELLKKCSFSNNQQTNECNKRLQRLKLLQESVSFKVARYFLNIKNKQQLNRKVSRLDMNNSPNSSSSSSNTSTTSSINSTSSSMSSNNSSSPIGPTMNNPISPNPLHTTTNFSITYDDLNERLFACLLSNFACKLTNNFLFNNTTNNGDPSENVSSECLKNTGFIRKNKSDKAFSFVEIVNTNDFHLDIVKNHIKLCFKLNKWPINYQKCFVERKRINTKWPSKALLAFIESNACLISLSDSVAESSFSPVTSSAQSEWQIDTQLAELILFKSLNKFNLYLFYLFYLLFINLEVDKHVHLFDFLNLRMFKHHFFRFVELNNFRPNTSANNKKKQHTNKHQFLFIVDLLKKFSNYLKFLLDKYKTFNAANYFDLSQSILKPSEMCSSSSTGKFLFMANEKQQKITEALESFESQLDNMMAKKLNDNQIQNVTLFNKYLQQLQVKLLSKEDINTSELELNNRLPAYSPYVSSEPFKSVNSYIYVYIYEYFNALFEQFKSKRDNFQISEQLVIQIHENTLDKLESDHFSLESVKRDMLIYKFEDYAESVHKYLPQIRHKHQFLLFHYIWTMQVQYLTPFFNYLFDTI